MIAAGNFHALYGEFFSLWKLWNYFKRDVGATALQGASRWDLLDRAARSEAKLEATLVRLAAERRLTQPEINALGQFRQLYQQLRECIRDDRPLAWDHSTHADYVRFKKLATKIAAIIAGEKSASGQSFLDITSNNYELPDRRIRGDEQAKLSSD